METHPLVNNKFNLLFVGVCVLKFRSAPGIPPIVISGSSFMLYLISMMEVFYFDMGCIYIRRAICYYMEFDLLHVDGIYMKNVPGCGILTDVIQHASSMHLC